MRPGTCRRLRTSSTSTISTTLTSPSCSRFRRGTAAGCARRWMSSSPSCCGAFREALKKESFEREKEQITAAFDRQVKELLHEFQEKAREKAVLVRHDRRGTAGFHPAQGGRRADRRPGRVRGAARGAQEVARRRPRGDPAVGPGVRQGPAGDRPQGPGRRRGRGEPLRLRTGRAAGSGDRGDPPAGAGAPAPGQGAGEHSRESRRFPGGGAPAVAALPLRVAVAARPVCAL